MRWPLIPIAFLAACTGEANHLGNPLLLPISGISTAIGNAAYDGRRGRVEVLVKSNHPALMSQIMAGSGPLLATAMETAGIPPSERAARIIQMQGDIGLYQQSPEALVTALMVYGS